MKKIPLGWRSCKLGEVVSLEYGKSLPGSSRTGNNYPVIGSNGEVGRHSTFLVQGPGIVVGRKGSHGEVNWVSENFFPIDTTYFVRVSYAIDIRFSYYLLKSVDLKSLNRSTAIPGLNRNDAYDLLIPLPPLAEQKRIVAKLDAAFAHLEKIKASLARIPELLKRFREAVLTQAVTGKLTEEWREGKEFNVSGEIALIKLERKHHSNKSKKVLYEDCTDKSEINGWAKIYIEEIFDIETGATPKRDINEYWDGGTIPWIKSGQVANKDITGADEYITQKALTETNAKVYPVNSILIAMYGEGKTRGQVGILKLEATSNQAIAAMVNPSLAFETIKYVYYFGLSQYSSIRKEASGGNQPNLNTGKIKKWKINFPPLSEQQEIVSRVESLFVTADATESQYNALKQKIDALPQALLAKAFRGELVPQDPDDEPATVLLERIRKEIGKLGRKVDFVE